ncbi:MAG: GNAT family N-acetyltransferase [Pseudomonadota bacterium]
MAILAPSSFTARNGAHVVLRSAAPGDARAVTAFKRAALLQSDYLNTLPGEYGGDVGAEKAAIRQAGQADNAVMLVAEAGGGLAGLVETKAEAQRRRAHNILMGIMVGEEWRGQGIGRALIERLLDWARRHPRLERLNLSVHAGNAPALALYRDLGFVEEGRRRAAIRYEDGKYMDEICMCAYLGGPYSPLSPSDRHGP